MKLINTKTIVAMLFVLMFVSACTESKPEPINTVASESEKTIALEKWARSCALCHINGEGGAPKTGDLLAWQERLDKGQDVLLRHTIEGFNKMPPLGYCMDCSEKDYLILIEFMAAQK